MNPDTFFYNLCNFYCLCPKTDHNRLFFPSKKSKKNLTGLFGKDEGLFKKLLDEFLHSP